MEITMPLHELAAKKQFWQPGQPGRQVTIWKNKFQDMVLVSSAFLNYVYLSCLIAYFLFDKEILKNYKLLVNVWNLVESGDFENVLWKL